MSRVFDIRKYGAVGDGKTDCTQAIQAAINECADAGGGTVLVESGTFLFYPLRFRSNVRLEIARDATLLAGTDANLYPEIGENPYWKVGYAIRNNRRYVFYGEGVEHVAICGEGKIDFQGKSFVNVDLEMKDFFGHWTRKHDQLIPGRSIFFVGSKDIRLEGLTMVDSAGWFTWFLDCERIRVENVTMHADLRMPNSDGIHFGACRDVVVSNCDICTGDDCIIIRAPQEQLDEPKVCENIVVTNCVLQSSTLALRIGWTHDYIMRNCTFSNLVIRRSSCAFGVTSPGFCDSSSDSTLVQRDPPRYPDTPKPYPEVKPFAVENFLFSNIVAETVRTFLRMPLDPSMKIDYVRNIVFRGVHAVSGIYPYIMAAPEHNVSDIEFTDFTLEMKYDPALELRYKERGRGSTGFDFHHVRNVIFNNFRIKETL